MSNKPNHGSPYVESEALIEMLTAIDRAGEGPTDLTGVNALIADSTQSELRALAAAAGTLARHCEAVRARRAATGTEVEP
jgi:hypothetical protein